MKGKSIVFLLSEPFLKIAAFELYEISASQLSVGSCFAEVYELFAGKKLAFEAIVHAFVFDAFSELAL